jgi:hypothetical protein
MNDTLINRAKNLLDTLDERIETLDTRANMHRFFPHSEWKELKTLISDLRDSLEGKHETFYCRTRVQVMEMNMSYYPEYLADLHTGNIYKIAEDVARLVEPKVTKVDDMWIEIESKLSVVI